MSLSLSLSLSLSPAVLRGEGFLSEAFPPAKPPRPSAAYELGKIRDIRVFNAACIQLYEIENEFLEKALS